IVHALGVAHQLPGFVLPIPGFQGDTLGTGLQSAVQTSAGVEIDAPGDVGVTSSVFQNAFFNLTDALGTGTTDYGPTTRTRGHAFGVELLVKKRLTHTVGGLVSYTLSRATRTLAGNTFVSRFDRTHVVNAALSLDLGRHFRAATRFVFY